MMQTRVRSGPAAASSIPLAFAPAEAVVPAAAAAAVVVASARDLRSSAKSLEQRFIKPGGGGEGRRLGTLCRLPGRR
jgi:hypothetical protein